MDNRITRRQALARAVEQASAAGRVRLVPRDQLVSVLEYEGEARRALTSATAALLADAIGTAGEGLDRAVFDRVTLRPRMLVPTLDLDLTVTLFGEPLFAPLVVAPVADQKRFHPDGEMATLRGAGAARTPVIVSSHASLPLATLKADATSPLWYQVFASDPSAKQRLQEAADAGCQAVCVTVGVKPPAPRATTAPSVDNINWGVVGSLIASSKVPVVVKGVTSVAEATAALQQGAAAIMVSNYGGAATHGGTTLVLQLPAIVAAVAGRVPVLVDGGFRRGTDIIKALASGAKAVAVGRPVMWGLAAYGADGVRGVLEMMQTELARYMAMCGKSRVDMLQSDILRVHAAAAPRSAARG